MDLFGQAWENLEFEASHPRKGTRTALWIAQSWRRLVLGARKVWEAAFYSQLSSAILCSAIGADAATTVFKRIHPPAPHGSGAAASSSSAPHGSSSWTPAPVPAYLDSSVTWARGKALPDSKRQAPFWRSKASCPHPEESMVVGCNASMYWECCDDCGARFQRVPLKIPGVKNVKAANATGEPYHLQPPLCPAQHGPMVARTNRQDGGMFWDCSKFPKCTHSQGIIIDGQRMRTYPRYGTSSSSNCP
jgi:hypothetical protein